MGARWKRTTAPSTDLHTCFHALKLPNAVPGVGTKCPAVIGLLVAEQPPNPKDGDEQETHGTRDSMASGLHMVPNRYGFLLAQTLFTVASQPSSGKFHLFLPWPHGDRKRIGRNNNKRSSESEPMGQGSSKRKYATDNWLPLVNPPTAKSTQFRFEGRASDGPCEDVPRDLIVAVHQYLLMLVDGVEPADKPGCFFTRRMFPSPANECTTTKLFVAKKKTTCI